MKKTKINGIPFELPKDISHFISGADVYDSSCSPEARVYFIDKENGYFLKCAKAGVLEKEAAKDSTRTSVLGLSRAGNVELIRVRRRPSLQDMLTVECETCQGTGRVLK